MGVGEEVRGQRILQFHSSLSFLCTVKGSLQSTVGEAEQEQLGEYTAAARSRDSLR